MASDENLMLRTAGGDTAAFNEIILRYQQTAWRLASRFSGNTHEAEDIAQEAFFRIFLAVPRYRPTASFTTYLYRIILRLCMDSTRKKRAVVKEEAAGHEYPGPGPGQQALDRERDAAVRAAIRRLPHRQRSAVILKEYMELPYRDIAEILHTTPKSVERLLCRARDVLRRELEPFFLGEKGNF
jgi:RNA polymerase sigma-70 factor (ECF subfamily)